MIPDVKMRGANCLKRRQGRAFCGVAAAYLFVTSAGAAAGQSVASPWTDHHERAQSRIVAAEHKGRLYAFVEIMMPEGWKTYWRNPGDAGGLPPTFDFAKSENVTGARVLYPAPKRLTDRAGDTIGYKGRAIFPVALDVAEKGMPVKLRLQAHFGVCRDICVPLEASHELDVAAGVVGQAEGALLDAIHLVPRPVAEARADDPRILRAQVDSYEAPAQISFTVTFRPGTTDAELFVEAPDGLYVPIPKRQAEPAADGTVAFEVTFGSTAELKQVLGKPLTVTAVGASGQSESIVTIE